VTLLASLLFLAALGVALALHEAAHALAAWLVGVPVYRFTLGAGPKLWSRIVRPGTELVLRVFPIWASSEVEGPSPDAPLGKLWRRALVFAAGPLASLAVAFGALAGLYFAGTHVPVPLTVGAVAPGSEAARAQLRPGDKVTAVDGAALGSWSELVDRIAESPGTELELQVQRGDRTQPLRVTPHPDERGEGRIGLAQQYVFHRDAPGPACARAGRHLFRSVLDVALLALRGRAHSSPPTRVPGAGWLGPTPGGADGAVRGVALLSALLGAFHLLPLPPLDGGGLLLLLLERSRRARYRRPTRVALHALGFAFLGAVLVLIAVRAA